MNTYFHLLPAYIDRLMADDNESYRNRLTLPCPISKEHVDGSRRVGPLHMHVKHNDHEQMMIWGWIEGYAVHQRMLDEYQRLGLTGYRTAPATIRFRDGSISHDYHEFIVTGWAGVAPPESGIRLERECERCHWKHYSPILSYEELIDWSQWTGDDFFIVWPLPRLILVTERAAEFLRRWKENSFRLIRLQDRDPVVAKSGFTVGRLSSFLPEDLAIRYGTAIGLE